jgi:hypothetical protein
MTRTRTTRTRTRTKKRPQDKGCPGRRLTPPGAVRKPKHAERHLLDCHSRNWLNWPEGERVAITAAIHQMRLARLKIDPGAATPAERNFLESVSLDA